MNYLYLNTQSGHDGYTEWILSVGAFKNICSSKIPVVNDVFLKSLHKTTSRIKSFKALRSF